MEVDRVLAAGAKRFGKVDEDGVRARAGIERRVAEQDAIDVQVRVQIELDPGVVASILNRMVFLPAMNLRSGSTRTSRW